jgi:predicted TIM-barrel fold metal-dependent hydrolase
MLTRRDAMIGAMSAGALMSSKQSLAKAAQPATPVNFDVPADACDCHTHIHGDPERFPFFAGRVYTPETALPEEMAALHRALHIKRVVIVTPSVYGTDNSATLYGMKARGADARGVAVIDDKTADAELDAMGKAGVRGIRLNLATGGSNDAGLARERFKSALPRMVSRNWHIQIYTNLAVIAGIKDLVLAAPVPVVFDHFGGARRRSGWGSRAFPISSSWSVPARPM